MKSDRKLSLAEQVVDDAALRVRLELRSVPGSSEPYRLVVKIAGLKAREYRFDEDGIMAGLGTHHDGPVPQHRLKVVKG
jgi:hypothetical protein